jgi:hypothetical protein
MVTDVGAGAGAQSRATDTHLILRPHEADGVVILDAVARSWPPVAPRCLRWDYPLWRPAPDLDPTSLRTSARRAARREDDTPAEPPWTAKRFAQTFGRSEPQARSLLLEAARQSGLSRREAERLLQLAVDQGDLFAWQNGGRVNGRMLVATARPPTLGQ